MTSRADIVAEVRSYVGTPFHHQASVPRVGLDCIGVLRSIGKRFDLPGSRELEASKLLAYGQDPDPALLRECRRFLDEITWLELRPGDVLMMRTLYSRGQPKHFAVVTTLDPVYIVHAWAGGGGKVVEQRLDVPWRSRVLACFRFKGLSDG